MGEAAETPVTRTFALKHTYGAALAGMAENVRALHATPLSRYYGTHEKRETQPRRGFLDFSINV